MRECINMKILDIITFLIINKYILFYLIASIFIVWNVIMCGSFPYTILNNPSDADSF